MDGWNGGERAKTSVPDLAAVALASVRTCYWLEAGLLLMPRLLMMSMPSPDSVVLYSQEHNYYFMTCQISRILDLLCNKYQLCCARGSDASKRCTNRRS